MVTCVSEPSMEIFDITGIALLSYSCYTLIVYGLVLTAVVLERKYSAVNAFYTLYAVRVFSPGEDTPPPPSFEIR